MTRQPPVRSNDEITRPQTDSPPFDAHERRVVAEWLFLETVSDLRSRCERESWDHYTALGVAGLLRKLLMDASPLLNEVRRHRQQQVKFTFTRWVPDPPDPAVTAAGGYPIFSGIGLPFSDASENIAVKNLSGFLAEKVASLEGQSISVKDLIRFYAVQDGSVHFQATPKVGDTSQRDNTWMLMTSYALSQGAAKVGPPLSMMIFIGRVVGRGLQPLARSIREHPVKSTWQHHNG